MADAPVEKKPPTHGLRVEVDKSYSPGMGGGIDTVVFAIKPFDAYGPSAEQAAVDAAYINWLIETDEKRRERAQRQAAATGEHRPSPELSLWLDDDGELFLQSGHKLVRTPWEQAQLAVNVTYINWLIETDERRRDTAAAQIVGTADVLVDLGDMRHQSIERVDIVDEAFESMVEDQLGNFNHIVTQGIQPVVAIYSMAMSFAIALGACLRANLADNQADALLAMVRQNAKNEAGRLKILTKQ
jgi:hypothetical protein